jgi:penicillin-binding protein 1A
MTESTQPSSGASTITMQLAGNLFLDRSDRSVRRKMQEILLALQIERRYTKPQIFTMYANQVYLAHGNYGFAAASQFYFGKPVTDLKLQEAALLAGMVNGPKFSPLSNPEAALNRRNLVLRRMEEEGKITPVEEAATRKSPLGLHIQYPRNDLAPYFFEDIRKYLEATYGTEAVHERGLRVYTTLNLNMQRIANQSLRDGLHAYERRHGWKGNLPNVVRDNLGKLDTYEDDDWRHSIEKGSYVTGLVLSMDEKNAVVKIGPYRAILSPAELAWTGRKRPAELLKIGDLAQFSIQELRDNTARIQLEQHEAQVASVRTPDTQAVRLDRKGPAIGVQREPWGFGLRAEMQGDEVGELAVAVVVTPGKVLTGGATQLRKRLPKPRRGTHGLLQDALQATALRMRRRHQPAAVTPRSAWMCRHGVAWCSSPWACLSGSTVSTVAPR